VGTQANLRLAGAAVQRSGRLHPSARGLRNSLILRSERLPKHDATTDPLVKSADLRKLAKRTLARDHRMWLLMQQPWLAADDRAPPSRQRNGVHAGVAIGVSSSATANSNGTSDGTTRFE